MHFRDWRKSALLRKRKELLELESLEMLKAIAAFGPGYEPPLIGELSESFLSKEKGRIEKSVALVRESWPHTGCTLSCVGVNTMVGSLLINIFVSSPRGLIFMKAVEENDIDFSGNSFSGVLCDAITAVGSANVLQIISHLNHDSKGSESIIFSKFPNIFWSPCSSHSIHLLMEEIAELDWIKPVVLCSKEIEKCIIAFQSNYPSVLAENFKGSSDSLFVKFAPSCYILQRVFELKQELQEIVVSEEWKQWKLNILEDIGSIEASILGADFWSRADFLSQICEPFLRLLAVLNIDRCVMGEVHEWRVQAFDAVRSKGIDVGVLNQLEELLDNRWDVLFSPLHAAGYILNPRYFGRGQTKDKIVMRGWKATLDRYESDSAGRRVLREQLSSYWRSEGSLGEEDAVDCRDKMDPVAWWENFGFETPHLQTLAIKILSQVSSVAMCEEISKDSDIPYQETANRLGVQRVEDLVFIRNNLRLQGPKSGFSSSPSGLKTWDGVHLELTKDGIL
ncbi:hAT transposon superfamily [Quillaja saponaria]|uniref:HAT transposon superfamily n=1 Tax=Quillaja saponaria TaxID=32244 RepID=A0AAD7QHW5_QUISA|nr:hAT transposon superfamily [Quillaja saponaria]